MEALVYIYGWMCVYINVYEFIGPVYFFSSYTITRQCMALTYVFPTDPAIHTTQSGSLGQNVACTKALFGLPAWFPHRIAPERTKPLNPINPFCPCPMANLGPGVRRSYTPVILQNQMCGAWKKF